MDKMDVDQLGPGIMFDNPPSHASHEQRVSKHAYPWARCLVASLLNKRKHALQDAWMRSMRDVSGEWTPWHGSPEEDRYLREAIFCSVQALFSGRATLFQGFSSAQALAFIRTVAFDVHKERVMKGRLIPLYPQNGWTNDPVQVYWHCLLGRLARLFLSLESAIHAALLVILPRGYFVNGEKRVLKVAQPSQTLQRFHDVVLKVMAGRVGCRPGMCKPPHILIDHQHLEQQQQQQQEKRRSGTAMSIDMRAECEGTQGKGSTSDQGSMDADEGESTEEEEEGHGEESHEAGRRANSPGQISWNGVPCKDSPVSALLVIQQQLDTLVSQQLVGIPDKKKWQEAEMKLRQAEQDIKSICNSRAQLRMVAHKQQIALMTLLSFLHSLMSVARDTALVSVQFLDENQLLKDARVFLCTMYPSHLLLDQIDRDERDMAVMELKGTGAGMDWNHEAAAGQMPGHHSADLEAEKICVVGQRDAEAFKSTIQQHLASFDSSASVWQVQLLVRLFEYCVQQLDARDSPHTHAHCKELAHKLSAVLPDPLKEHDSTGSSGICPVVQRRFHFWHGRLQALQACPAAAAAAFYHAAAAAARGGGNRMRCLLDAADAFLAHAKMRQQAGDLEAAMDAANRGLKSACESGSRKHIIQAAVLCAILLTAKARKPGEAAEQELVAALKVNLLALKQLRGLLPFGVSVANAESMVSQCRWLLDCVKTLSSVSSKRPDFLEKAEHIFRDATEAIDKAKLPSSAQSEQIVGKLKLFLQLYRRLPTDSANASPQEKVLADELSNLRSRFTLARELNVHGDASMLASYMPLAQQLDQLCKPFWSKLKTTSEQQVEEVHLQPTQQQQARENDAVEDDKARLSVEGAKARLHWQGSTEEGITDRFDEPMAKDRNPSMKQEEQLWRQQLERDGKMADQQVLHAAQEGLQAQQGQEQGQSPDQAPSERAQSLKSAVHSTLPIPPLDGASVGGGSVQQPSSQGLFPQQQLQHQQIVRRPQVVQPGSQTYPACSTVQDRGSSFIHMPPEIFLHPAFDGKMRRKLAMTSPVIRALIFRACTAITVPPSESPRNGLELQAMVGHMQKCFAQGLVLKRLSIHFDSFLTFGSDMRPPPAVVEFDFKPFLKGLNLWPLTALTSLLELDCTHLTLVESLAPLASMTHLQRLNCRGMVTVGDLGPLAALTGLTALDCSNSRRVTQLGPLASLTQLEQLDCNNLDKVTTLAPLASMTNLQRLNCNGMILVEDLGPLTALTGLKALDLSNLVRVIDLGPLAALTRLEVLECQHMEDVNNLAPLASLKGLQRLSCAWMDNVLDLGPLAALTNLTSLDCRCMRRVVDLRPLNALRGLERLDCRGMKRVTEVGPFAAYANLRHLWFDEKTAYANLKHLFFDKKTGMTPEEELLGLENFIFEGITFSEDTG